VAKKRKPEENNTLTMTIHLQARQTYLELCLQVNLEKIGLEQRRL